MEAEGKQVLQQLLDAGYEGYFVGGYVRDIVAGKEVKDIDIATSATPEQVMSIFERTVPTGLQHGTVTVLCDTFQFEVTTFRTESSYIHHRRPEKVEFVTNLHEDLKRRDFTMNAMAMDIEGKIIDPFHGHDDLQCGIIRCVGNAIERLEEDALRMVRCVRFAANFGLHIEEETWNAILEKKSLLQHIAMERIQIELQKMMTGRDPFQGIWLLKESGLLHYTKRPITLFADALEHITMEHQHHVNALPLHNSISRWCNLFTLLGMNAEEASTCLRHLCFSNQHVYDTKQSIQCVHFLSELNDHWSEEEALYQWREAVLLYGKDVVQRVLDLFSLDKHIREEIDTVPSIYPLSSDVIYFFASHGQRCMDDMKVYTVKDLQLSGTDLLPLHPERGSWIREVLHQLMKEVSHGQLANERDVLMSRAKSIIPELT